MMNATRLYVSTCRLILNANVDDTSSWLDIYKLFPCLRQSLACTVCGNLLIEPYTPTESNCEHHVCRSCKGGRKKLKPSCSWCKDYNKYVENSQLRTLLQCYKKLCQYITSNDIYPTLVTHPSTSNNSSNEHNGETLLQIIKEGSGFKDDFKNNLSISTLPFKQTTYKTISTQTINIEPKSDERLKSNETVGNNNSSTYSVIYTDNGNRLTFKRTAKEIHDMGNRNGESNTNSTENTKVNKVRKRSTFLKPPTCKCGGSNQAKGSCRGYRCPCYSADKSCLDCVCIGCKNPRGVSIPREPAPPPADSVVEVAMDASAPQKNNPVED